MIVKSIDNEKSVLMAISQGNTKAFSQLFYAYHQQFGQYVFSITKSNELAEEIVQDVFFKLWENREKLSAINNIEAYIFILAKNQTLNAIRKLDTEKKRREDWRITLEPDDLVEEQERAEVENEMIQTLQHAVSNLPPQQQKVFLLRQQGLKHDQIASVMSISLNSAKKYQQLAVQSIEKFVKAKATASLFIYLFLKFF